MYVCVQRIKEIHSKNQGLPKFCELFQSFCKNNVLETGSSQFCLVHSVKKGEPFTSLHLIQSFQRFLLLKRENLDSFAEGENLDSFFHSSVLNVPFLTLLTV